LQVTTSVENEAAAILSTFSHSVNTVIPLHDEKALRNSLNESLLASPIINNQNDDIYGRQSLDALAAAALQASSKITPTNLSTTLSGDDKCKEEGEKWMVRRIRGRFRKILTFVCFRSSVSSRLSHKT
jgi:hypothetical protein